MKLFIALFLVAVVSAKLLNDPARVAEINAKASWVAGENTVFDGVDVKDAHHFLGLMKRPVEYMKFPLIKTHILRDLPKSFDARVEWPGRIVAIRDQAQCGSCWAFGATEALSDRFNVAHKSDPAVLLSPQQLVSCDTTSYGCSGGYPDKAWMYMEQTGVVTDACYPYTSAGGETGECLLNDGPKAGEQCPSGTGDQVVYHANQAGRLPADVNAIMSEMVQNGPIEMGFHVYDDFFNYKSGVYYHVSGGLAGGHAIKCIGYGHDTTSNLDYWICANSWGTGWGIQGYFWIKKGTDECGIESWFTAAGKAGKIDK